MYEFLAMSGYAAYVWPAFGFTVVVLGGLWWLSWRQLRASERELERWKERARGMRAQARTTVIEARREKTADRPSVTP